MLVVARGGIEPPTRGFFRLLSGFRAEADKGGLFLAEQGLTRGNHGLESYCPAIWGLRLDDYVADRLSIKKKQYTVWDLRRCGKR